MAKWNHESKLNYKNSFCLCQTVAHFYFYALILWLQANIFVMQTPKFGISGEERESEKQKKITSFDRMNNKHQTTNKDNETKKKQKNEKQQQTAINDTHSCNYTNIEYINYLYSLYFNLAIIQCGACDCVSVAFFRSFHSENNLILNWNGSSWNLITRIHYSCPHISSHEISLKNAGDSIHMVKFVVFLVAFFHFGLLHTIFVRFQSRNQ